MSTNIQRNEYVQAFERGLAVISCFDGSSLTLSEVAQRVDMSPAAARRYLSTLTELGFFSQRNGKFSAQAKLLELSNPYFAANDFMASAQPVLHTLARHLDETTSLTQLMGHEVVNVMAVQAPHELSINVVQGHRLPAYCTAMGRAMLSLRPEAEVRELLETLDLQRLTAHTLTRVEEIAEQIELARTRGYAFVEEEQSLGIRTMSMAFRTPQGRIAAFSAPTPTARESRDSYLRRIEEPLRKAVAQIESH